MREIVHIQAGQCGNQIGAKVSYSKFSTNEKYKNYSKETNCSNILRFFFLESEFYKQHVKSCLWKKNPLLRTNCHTK